jgi:hypothetical protein
VAVRFGWMSAPLSRAETASGFGPGRGATTSTWCRDGATCPSFQSSNEIVTVAEPAPADSGTRTGSSKLYVQQRCFSSYSSRTGLSPGRRGG